MSQMGGCNDCTMQENPTKWYLINPKCNTQGIVGKKLSKTLKTINTEQRTERTEGLNTHGVINRNRKQVCNSNLFHGNKIVAGQWEQRKQVQELELNKSEHTLCTNTDG